MEEILKMLANYYIIFIILALIGIFAIIGYFIEKKHPRQEYKEPELDMEAVARKGGQGLGATLGQNPTTTDDEVEMLDMNMGPTTFANNTTPASSNNTNANLNNQETNKEQNATYSNTNNMQNSNIDTNANQNPTSNSNEILSSNNVGPTNPGFKSPF